MRTYLSGKTLLLFALFVTLPLVVLASPPTGEAEPASVPAGKANPLTTGLGYVAAALAVGLGSIGAGLAVASTAAAAVGAVAEREEVAGKALVFVGLAEGVAIYGMVIAIMILIRL